MTSNIAISNCAGATLPSGKTDQLPNTTIIRAGVTTTDNFGDVANTSTVSVSNPIGNTLAITGVVTNGVPAAPFGAFCTATELIWAVRMAVEGRSYGTLPDPAGTGAAKLGTRGAFTHSYTPTANDVDAESFGPQGLESTLAVGWTGWVLYDTFPIAGDGDPSCIATQVFRSKNKDGFSYKYAIFRWNLLLNEINITSCEAWDKVTRTSTNETHSYFDSSPIPYKLNETKLVLMINPRWLVLQSIIFDEPSVWSGVFETAREDITDVATATNPGLPCWGWISSTLWSLGAKTYLDKPMGSGAGLVGTVTASDYTLINMPRTKSGATGFGAAKGWGADYGVAQYPNWLTTGTTSAAFVTYLSNDSTVGNKFQANSWDTTKRLVLPIKPIHDYGANFVANYGTIFGLKVLAPIGPMMTKIKVNTDDDGNYTPVITSTSTKIHWLLNTHHKASSGTTADSNSWFQNTQLGVTNIYLNGATMKPLMLVNVGSYCYVLAESGTAPATVGSGVANKFLRVNQSSQLVEDLTPTAFPTYTAPQLSTMGVLSGSETGIPASFTDIRYDGDQFVYLATNTGLIRYNISTGDMINRVKQTVGGQAIAFTASRIYLAPALSSATPKIYSLDRATFAWRESSTDILLTNFTDDVIMVDACTGADGSVYFTPVLPNAASYQTRYRLIKIDPAGVVSYHTFAAATQNLLTQQAGLQVLDNSNLLLWQATGAGTACTLYVQRINTTKMTKQTDTTPNSISLGGTQGINPGKRIQFAKIQGVVIAAPYFTGTIGSYATLQLCSQSTSNVLGELKPVAGLSGTVNIPNATTPTGGNLFHWDGVRFYGNTENNLHIFSKLNSESCFSDGSKNILLGQVTLPA